VEISGDVGSGSEVRARNWSEPTNASPLVGLGGAPALLVVVDGGGWVPCGVEGRECSASISWW